MNKAMKPKPRGNCNHKRRFNAQEKQRILFLSHSELLSVDQIASRFRSSKSTVLQVLDAYEAHPHNPGAVQPSEIRPRRKALRAVLSAPGPGVWK